MIDRKHQAAATLRSAVTEFLLLCALGFVVTLVMTPLVELDLLRSIDRNFADHLMRQLARDQLMEPQPGAPRFVYVDVSERTCEIWAAAEGTSCTLDMVTPRDRLARLVRNLSARAATAGGRPRLLVIDIELSPLPHGPDEPMQIPDVTLCSAVADLSRMLPVIVIPSLLLDTVGTGPRLEAYPTILQSASGKWAPCADRLPPSDRNGGLWFASPMLQQHPDGIVRSVHAWDTVRKGKTGIANRIAGVGFLGAALLDPATDLNQLTCLFPASSLDAAGSGSPSCAGGKVAVGGRTYPISKDEPSRTDQIMFFLPYEAPGQATSLHYGFAPSVIDTVDAATLDDALPDLLGDAIVVIGGSYSASGDLNVTPLGPDMPGAMVLANAIRAYATGKLVTERHSWGLEIVLVGATALVGVTFSSLSGIATRRFGPVAGDLGRMAISLVGVAVAMFVVLTICITRGFAELAETGTVLATLTPALTVALEGVCSSLQELKQLVLGVASGHLPR